MGGRAPFHMFDARCELGEVSIKCSDVGFGEVCLALVMDGVDTPFVYRLFEAREKAVGRNRKGRKKWEGAEDAILRTAGMAPRRGGDS